ncbi:MAG: sulfite exporter TauE/SafE family protein [Candidatus Dojkabacteria bacterium]|nr:sulfite exporter TauE/SafE family protein [Candidatus Dojkabacteria bacterium]
MMDQLPILFITIISIFIAFILKGISGFGTSLILMPILSQFMDIKAAIVLSALADLLSSFSLALKFNKNILWKKVRLIGLGLFIGTLIGVNILNSLDSEILKKLLGIFIIMYVLLPFLISKLYSSKHKTALGLFSGLAGGVCGGIFNTNGPPIIMYMSKVLKDKNTIRATLLSLFSMDSIWRVALYSYKGLITTSLLLQFAAFFLPSMIFGLYLSIKIDTKIKSGAYTKIVKGLLFASGVSMLIR